MASRSFMLTPPENPGRIATLNVAATLIMIATMIVAARVGDGVWGLFAGLSLFACSIVLIASVLSVPFLWAKYRTRAFVPLITAALCAGTVAGLMPAIRWIGNYGTPRDPDWFLNNSRKHELEEIAGKLLGNSFERILTLPSQTTEITMLEGHPSKALPAGVSEKLRSYGLHVTTVDDKRSLVIFRHYHFRTFFTYLFSTAEIDEKKYPYERALGEHWYYNTGNY